MPNKSKQQHITPCHDCPWRRIAPKGWLGSEQTPEEWIETAHSDATAECHTRAPHRCAGLAIYRANVFKSVRDPDEMRLPADRERVFASPAEFIAHHRSGAKLTSAEVMRMDPKELL